MFYHAVSTKNPEGRMLLMDKVNWKDGWPSVTGNSPSIEAERPEMQNSKMKIEYEVKKIVFRDNAFCGHCKYRSSKLYS